MGTSELSVETWNPRNKIKTCLNSKCEGTMKRFKTISVTTFH